MARKKLLSEGEVRQFMKLANLNDLSENYFTNNPLEEESEEESELHATEDELGAEDHFADEEGDDLDALADEGGDNEALLARVVQAVADELGVEVDVEGADEEGGDEELDVDAELDMGGEDVDFAMDAEEEVPGNMDLYEDKPFTSKKEKPGADKRKGAEKRGAEGTRKKTGADKGEDAYVNEQAEELDEIGTMVGSTERPPTARERGLAKGGYAQAERAERRKCEGRGGNWADGECHESGERGASNPLTQMGEELDQEAIVAEVARRVAERLSGVQRKEELAEQLAERIFNRLTSK
jgi:hypothetical protein